VKQEGISKTLTVKRERCFALFHGYSTTSSTSNGNCLTLLFYVEPSKRHTCWKTLEKEKSNVDKSLIMKNNTESLLRLITKNKIDLVSPILKRLILLITIVIWTFSLVYITYNFVNTSKKTFIYFEDLKIINEIEEEFNKTHLNQSFENYNNTGVTKYYDADSYYLKFTKLSFYNGNGFVPELVQINLDNAKKELGENPILLFFKNNLFLVISINFLYLLLINLIFWLKFGENHIEKPDYLSNEIDSKFHFFQKSLSKNHFKYYIIEGEKQSAPLSFEQLKEKEINEETLVWRNGLKEWMPAKSIKEIHSIINYTPPPLSINDGIDKNPKRKIDISKMIVKSIGILCVIWFIIAICFKIFNPQILEVGRKFVNTYSPTESGVSAIDDFSKEYQLNNNDLYTQTFDPEKGVVRMVFGEEKTGLVSSLMAKLKTKADGGNQNFSETDLDLLIQLGKKMGIKVINPQTQDAASAQLNTFEIALYKKAKEIVPQLKQQGTLGKYKEQIQQISAFEGTVETTLNQRKKLDQIQSRIAEVVLDANGNIKDAYKDNITYTGETLSGIPTFDLSKLTEAQKNGLKAYVGDWKIQPVQNQVNISTSYGGPQNNKVLNDSKTDTTKNSFNDIEGNLNNESSKTPTNKSASKNIKKKKSTNQNVEPDLFMH